MAVSGVRVRAKQGEGRMRNGYVINVMKDEGRETGKGEGRRQGSLGLHSSQTKDSTPTFKSAY